MPKTQLSPIYVDAEVAKDQGNGNRNAHTKNGNLTKIVRKKKKRIVFGWYGGKFSHLEWLLPLLPESHHYCEPFAGSAAVLLNRKPSPVETYNDVDGEVVNFFRVLRDKRRALIEAIGLTPFSREEFYNSLPVNGANVSEIERARRF